MSGECGHRNLASFGDSIIRMPKQTSIIIDLDRLKDVGVMSITRHGKTIVFPIWEFWQVLEQRDQLGKE